jgi:hypothetical protein
MAAFVQSLQSEIDALEASLRTSPDPRVTKLRELKKVLALYHGEAISPGPKRSESPASQKRGRRISPERQAAIEATIVILRQATRPLKTAALYEMISDLGVRIGGANPVNNYSALLYGRDEFHSHRRGGWTLREEEIRPNAAMEDEADDNTPAHFSS